MVRTAACLSAALALVAFAAAPAARAADGDDLVGIWHSEVDGLKETITIKSDGASWSVYGVYHSKTGKILGNFTAKNVTFGNGKLQYTQEFTKKPNPIWLDPAPITITPAGDNKIKYDWGTGSRVLEKRK